MRTLQKYKLVAGILIIFLSLGNFTAHSKTFMRVDITLENSLSTDEDIYQTMDIDRFETNRIEVDDSNEEMEYMIELYTFVGLSVNSSEYLNITYRLSDTMISSAYTTNLEESDLNSYELSEEHYDNQSELSMIVFNGGSDHNRLPEVSAEFEKFTYIQQFHFSHPLDSLTLDLTFEYYLENDTRIKSNSTTLQMTNLNYPNNLVETPISSLWVIFGVVSIYLLRKFKR